MNTRIAQCRHGTFTYHSQDRFVGTSLRIYGEYSEGEVLMYDAFLKSTDVVIEVGANIGALTIPLARRCRKVFAFEPQPESFHLLGINLADNGVVNVDTFPYAVGDVAKIVNIPTIEEIDLNYGRVEIGPGSHSVEQRRLDDLYFEKIDFIKMDCEGMELDVLKGAENLIKRDWPLLYVENDRPAKSASLVEWLVDHGYHCYWHRPPLYRENNFRKYGDNIFGVCDSQNMICCRDRNRNSGWLTEEVL